MALAVLNCSNAQIYVTTIHFYVSTIKLYIHNISTIMSNYITTMIIFAEKTFNMYLLHIYYVYVNE